MKSKYGISGLEQEETKRSDITIGASISLWVLGAIFIIISIPTGIVFKTPNLFWLILFGAIFMGVAFTVYYN
jgi:hypothetical protein